MSKKYDVKQNDTTFEYQVGSNVVIVNGNKKYLDIVVAQEVTYENIKDHIVG